MKGPAARNQAIRATFLSEPLPDYGSAYLIHLHTQDPVGDPRAHLPAFPGYAPVSLPRNVAGWTVCREDGIPDPAGPAAHNARDLQFPECSSGSWSITHVSVSTTAGQVQHVGALSRPVVIEQGIVFRIPAGRLLLIEG